MTELLSSAAQLLYPVIGVMFSKVSALNQSSEGFRLLIKESCFQHYAHLTVKLNTVYWHHTTVFIQRGNVSSIDYESANSISRISCFTIENFNELPKVKPFLKEITKKLEVEYKV